jgi:hypothetical protein
LNGMENRGIPRNLLEEFEGRAPRKNVVRSSPAGPESGPRAASRIIMQSNSESVNPRDSVAQNQGVDIVGAFVGLDGFQIRHVAEDRVFVGDSVGA